MKTLIVEVLGNLPSGYRERFYSLKGKLAKKKAHFPGQALQEGLLEGQGAELILLAPLSLVTLIAEDAENAERLLKDPRAFKAELLKRIDGETGLRDYRLFPIPSLGLYLKKDSPWSVSFENTSDLVTLAIFSHLLRVVREEEEKEGVETIIIDLSIGHNLYYNPLWDALRVLLVASKLKRMMMEEDRALRVQSCISPPLPNGDLEIPLQLLELDVRAFFDFPIMNIRDLDKIFTTDIKRGIYKDLKIIKDLVGKGRRAFATIKHNLPLAFLTPSLINLEQKEGDGIEALLRIIDGLVSSSSIQPSKSGVRMVWPKIEGKPLLNAYIALVLHDALRGLRERMLRDMEKAITLSRLEELFKELYGRLKLEVNYILLARDVEEIREKVKGSKGKLKEGEEFSLLEELWCDQGGGDGGRKVGDERRNFLVHSGLLKKAVRVRAIDDELELTYDEKFLREKKVSRWIDDIAKGSLTHRKA